jgi:hypothetical protein
MELLDTNFAGPLCYYQILDDRRKNNPSFLTRNLPFREKLSRKRSNENISKVINSNEPSRMEIKLNFLTQSQSGSMSFHIIAFRAGRASSSSGSDKRSPHRIASDFIQVEQQTEIIQQLIIPPTSLPEDSTYTDFMVPSLFVLILFSNNPKKNSSIVHVASANAFCDKLGGEEFSKTSPEEMTLTFSKKGSYFAMILDLSPFQRRPNQQARNPLLAFSEPLRQHEQRSRLVKKFKSYVHYDRLDPSLWDESIFVSFSAKSFTENSLHAKKKRIVSNCSGLSQRNTVVGKLMFHFSAVDSSNKVSCWRESYDVFDCPWCTVMRHVKTPVEFRDSLLTHMSTAGLNELVNHMIIFHPHFSYEVAIADDRFVHIIVQRRRVADKKVGILVQHPFPLDYYLQNPCEKKVTKLKKSCDSSLVSQKQLRTSSSKVAPTLDIAKFFHPATGQTLKPLDAIVLDKHIDISSELLTQHMVIDEYEDISMQEKQLMKLWNSHVASFETYGEKFLPLVCEMFVRRFGGEIANKGLRHNLLLHFMTMWDFGLLLSEEIEHFMNLADIAIASSTS